MKSYLLHDISLLYCVAQHQEACKKGQDMQDASLIEEAFVYVERDQIKALGPMSQLPEGSWPGAERINCAGRMVLPGFVDSHTHLVFPRTREQEYVYRIQGMSYEEIAEKGGGILNSARSLQDIPEAQLLEETHARAEEILRLGTTTVEIKSGYGLTVEGELKLLRVANQLKSLSPLNIRTTFLGAHAIPLEYKTNRQAYIDLVCDVMLPQVADEGLAEFIDVFCDTGFFTIEETEYILKKGEAFGMPGKIHANELDFSGGVQIGVKCGAYSVDHLERSGKEEIEALKGSDTVPCLLPSVAYFLGISYGPARDMIEAGLPVALATDYNPGSSPGGSMPFVMSLACTKMKMLPEEALVASTLNGAWALRMSDTVGSIEPGKQADLLVSQPNINLARIPYSYSSNLIDKVMIGGEWQ